MLMGLGAVGAGLVLAAWMLRDTGAGAPPAPPVAIARHRADVERVAHRAEGCATASRIRPSSSRRDRRSSRAAGSFASTPRVRTRTYLYVVNEGKGDGDATTLHLLFPAPGINDGSAQLSPGGAMQTGWYVFTQNPGTESFWLVAAREPVPQLEAVKGVVNHRDQGLGQRRRAAGRNPGVACQREPAASQRREGPKAQAHGSSKF